MKAEAPGHESPANLVPRGHEPPSSVPVLLIPGGTENGVGSLSGLGEFLADHPVISMDAVGAGPFGDQDPATLAPRSAACLRVVGSHSGGPAVVVGHSLGGVVAVQVAMDHPDAVAGLVLLDPTPFTDLRMMRSLRRSSRLLALPGRVPLVGRRLDRALAGVLSLDDAAGPSQPGRNEPSRLRATAGALASVPDDGQALRRRLHLLDVPVVVVTADREFDHPMRRSHHEIAEALGGAVLRLHGAGHAMHLTHTEDIAALVRDVVATLRTRA